jgi:hypothetical protein
VDRDACTTKFWLEPVTLAWNRGFPVRELTRSEEIIRASRESLLEAWNDHFGD